MNTRIKFLAASTLMALTACSTGGYFKTVDSPRSPAATHASQIKIFSTQEIGFPYETLGTVVANADGGDDSSKAISILREQAAALGANAIVGLRLAVSQGMWNAAVRATGTAVYYGERHQ